MGHIGKISIRKALKASYASAGLHEYVYTDSMHTPYTIHRVREEGARKELCCGGGLNAGESANSDR